jgi:hypothetical protein
MNFAIDTSAFSLRRMRPCVREAIQAIENTCHFCWFATNSSSSDRFPARGKNLPFFRRRDTIYLTFLPAMRKPFFSYRSIAACSESVLLLLAAALSLPGQESAVCAERLRVMGEKIDSIEVEKQKKKRAGQSIGELEAEVSLLRDSVKALRTEIQKEPAAARAPAKSFPGKALLLSRICLFDWLLIGAGGAAAAFAAVLLFLFFRALSRPRTGNVPHRREPAPTRVQSAAQKAYAAQSGAVGNGEPAGPKPEPQPPAAPPPVPPLATAVSGSPKNLVDLVVKADREGIDIREISRRYHISADEVALILKMAKKP